MLANTRGQKLPVAGVSHSGALRRHEELVQATVADGQTLADAANDLALHHPLLKSRSNTQSSTASGHHNKEVLNEVGVGTTLMAAFKPSVYIAESNKAQRKRPVHRTGNNPLDTELKCSDCNKSFNSKKDLNRHLRTTKAHNGPIVARCSCGRTVTRKDAMASHRRYCRGTTEEIEPDA